jgi:hypothetical protein
LKPLEKSGVSPDNPHLVPPSFSGAFPCRAARGVRHAGKGESVIHIAPQLGHVAGAADRTTSRADLADFGYLCRKYARVPAGIDVFQGLDTCLPSR